MMEISLRLALALEAEGNLFSAAAAVAEQEGAAAVQRLFLSILSPLLAMGAVEETAQGKRIDVLSLRRFFLGVLGWTPKALFDEASLQDLQAAWEGHAAASGLRRPPVDSAFLREMMRKFPDLAPDIT